MKERNLLLNKTLLNSCFALPLIWFSAYIILVLIGGVASLSGATDSFYCNVYCKIGIWIIIGATGTFIAYQAVKYIRTCTKR